MSMSSIHYRKRNVQHFLYLLLFAGPGLIYLTIGRVIPLLYTAYLSLHSWSLISSAAPVFTGLKNYSDILYDPRFASAMGFTLRFTVVVVVIELVFGLALALLVDRVTIGKGSLQTILLIPMFITPVAVATIWYILFNATIGPINYLVLSALHISPINWLETTHGAFVAIVCTDVWQWTPFMFLLLYAALQTADPEVYDAARVDGAGGVRLLFSVTIPLIKAPMIAAVVLRAIDAFRIFDTIYVITGGGPGSSTESISLLIYKTAFTFYRLDQASAMAIILLFFLATCYYLARAGLGGKG